MALISGKMLKDVRGHKRLSQEALAERSRVSLATIKRIERCDKEYACRTLSAKRIASALGVQVADLAEDRFSRVVDIGGDIELHIDWDVSPDGIREGAEHLIELIESRNRILKR